MKKKAEDTKLKKTEFKKLEQKIQKKITPIKLERTRYSRVRITHQLYKTSAQDFSKNHLYRPFKKNVSPEILHKS